MVDIFKAMGVSAAVLLPVVILTLFISIVTFKRGAAAMQGGHDHGHGLEPALAGASAAGGAVAAKKVTVVGDPTVGEILVFGAVLFGLAVVLLFGFSIISHLS